MKRILIFIISLCFAMPLLAQEHNCSACGKCGNAIQLTEQQQKTLAKLSPFSVLGDSYSTFQGHTAPTANAQWYPLHKGNDVSQLDQTWWKTLEKISGMTLDKNNSYSGATVCNTGYGKKDFSDRSFVTRATNLGSPRLIIVEGATNDSWANSPIGEYKYKNWTAQDLKSFRPACAKMLYLIKKTYPKAKVIYMLNSELKDSINESVDEVCKHYKVPVLHLQNIEKQQKHPSQTGMKAIARQTLQFLIQK